MSIKALGGLQLPSQKEFAAGVGGLLAFGIIAGCHALGYDLSDTVDTLLVVALPPIITKLVPPSFQDTLAHVNDDIVNAGVAIGQLTPQTIIVPVAPQQSAPLMGSGPGAASMSLDGKSSDSPVEAGPIGSGAAAGGSNSLLRPATQAPAAVDAAAQAEQKDPLAHYKPPGFA